MAGPARRLLLDANVWIALLDDDHVHNTAARRLFKKRPPIATCPLTENATLRIMNMPSYTRAAKAGFGVIRQRMARALQDADHAHWPDGISLIHDDVLDLTRMSGHHQLTDAYLLALAVRHGGTLATFDQRIALSAVRGATPDHLLVL